MSSIMLYNHKSYEIVKNVVPSKLNLIKASFQIQENIYLIDEKS